MKRLFFVWTFLFIALFVFVNSGICFEDCFNYDCMRQDLCDKYGWEVMDKWKKHGKDLQVLEKRWPNWQIEITPEEEKNRFGTTGLELMQKQYIEFHNEGSTYRMFVYMKVVHPSGVRKLCGFRAETNPQTPSEYLDPNFPNEKKEGPDWFLIYHWVYPSDTRGNGIFVISPNNKARENDMWVWFPSLRKSRRITPAGGGDSLGGTDITFAESFLWMMSDETFQIIGETSYKNFLPIDYYDGLYILDKYGPLTKEAAEFVKGKVAQPRDCWVVRSKSLKGGYADWYDTRITIMDKEWGIAYAWEIFDKRHRLMKSTSYYWKKSSDYNGKSTLSPFYFCEVLNFENRGFTYIAAPQTVYGCPVTEAWFSLRELKKSIPTAKIVYMMPPLLQKLAPLEELYNEDMMKVRKKIFPQGRLTSFTNADTELIGWDKWVSSSE